MPKMFIMDTDLEPLLEKCLNIFKKNMYFQYVAFIAMIDKIMHRA